MMHMKQKIFYVRVVVDGYGPSFEFKVLVRVNNEHHAEYTARLCTSPQRARSRLIAESYEIGYRSQQSAAIGAATSRATALFVPNIPKAYFPAGRLDLYHFRYTRGVEKWANMGFLLRLAICQKGAFSEESALEAC
jgi:hypothetical protein